MPKLSFSSIFADDVEQLAEFYRELFGFEMEGDTPTYRGLKTGSSTLGISSTEVYGMLDLPKPESRGIGTFLTFDVDHRVEVDELTERARTLGARVMKPPFETVYGWYQSVLLDPEGNAFRINVSKR
jgi:predicted enzyme related to lactoylglutathione lyase